MAIRLERKLPPLLCLAAALAPAHAYAQAVLDTSMAKVSPIAVPRTLYPRRLRPAAQVGRVVAVFMSDDDRPAPFSQLEVPTEQQPVVEMRNLREEPFFDWAELPDEQLVQRLAALYSFFAIVISLPIALTTFATAETLPQALLATHVGGSGVVLAFLLRLRTGWGYVSMRLRDRQTYYEENGASGRGGYLAEKDAEATMRDRLLDDYEVQPVLRKVDRLSAVVGGSLGLAAIALRTLTPDDPYKQFSNDYLSQLQMDDKLAAKEQQRAQSQSLKPSYCDSRYYKAIAGGEKSGLCD
uniref:Uncharacterized protein n=1 Tax=Chrysotila carterae TaxID=13221 RepID=A0A6S9UH15_CHRCT